MWVPLSASANRAVARLSAGSCSTVAAGRAHPRAPAKGGAKVRLEDVEGGTKLIYDVEANVGGKIAQLGGRLINGVAKKYADDFFANFAKILAPAETAA